MSENNFQQVDSSITARFAGIATFMGLPHSKELDKVDVVIAGIPFDGAVTFRPGARFGPREIRSSSCLTHPYNPYHKVYPFKIKKVADYGDLNINPLDIEETHESIENGIDKILHSDTLPMLLGGDHSITLPILRSIAKLHGPVGMIHFDAHPDNWDSYMGKKNYHGSTMRRALEEKLIDPKKSLQIGIRCPFYSEEEFCFSNQQGLRMITTDEIKRNGLDWVIDQYRLIADKKVYVSLDIDVVDPAFAPGTGTPEVGGLSSYEIIYLVRGLRGLKPLGFDLVEVAPNYDHGNITTILAANLLFELLCIL